MTTTKLTPLFAGLRINWKTRVSTQGEKLKKGRKKGKKKTKYSKNIKGSIYLCKSALHLENVPVHIISYNYKNNFYLMVFFPLTMSCFIYFFKDTL